MKAIIPAAGEGTRLRPLTETKPKAMVEVDGDPLLAHVFRSVQDIDVQELIVIVGYRLEEIISHFGTEFNGIPITYVHQRNQLGLAHAVHQAEPHVDDTFIVVNGDNVFLDSIEAADNIPSNPDVDATILTETVSESEAANTGVVEAEGTDITSITEKPDHPASTTVTTGWYLLPEEIFDAIDLLEPSDRGEYELTDAIAVLLRAGATVKAVPYGANALM